ncbi:MAG: hypothetical protein R3C03_10375 [Pirellulaceae bacterium]
MPKLLEMIASTCSHFSMHCIVSKKTAQSIIDKGGDYVIAVKEINRTWPSQFWMLSLRLKNPEKAAKSTGLRTKVDKSCIKSGRKNRITRTYKVMPVPDSLKTAFPGIRSIASVYREQERPQKDGSGKKPESISSLSAACDRWCAIMYVLFGALES